MKLNFIKMFKSKGLKIKKKKKKKKKKKNNLKKKKNFLKKWS